MEVEKIIVLQNTRYHFETALSVYKSLENMGVEPYLHQCHGQKDITGQLEFVSSLGMRIASEQNMESARCAFVVSAYPNPHGILKEWIPCGGDPSIERFGKRIVYISHRFTSSKDYDFNGGPVRRHNSICLSPLSSRIGVDYMWPVDMPIKPEMRPLYRPVQFTVQGRLELANRLTPDWMFAMEDGSNRAWIRFLGGKYEEYALPADTKTRNLMFLPSQSESSFYKNINKETNFLMPMIDRKIKDGMYEKDRFSSTFNHAFAMEKPVFCHIDFKGVYGVPGVYYDDENASEMAEKIFRMTREDYESMTREFSTAKRLRRNHNARIIRSKIEAVCWWGHAKRETHS